MLNKCLHLISIKESTPGGGAKARPGKTPASDELLLSFPLGKMGPLMVTGSQRTVPVSSTV